MPGDCFQLGNPDKNPQSFLHEKPIHEVCLDGFWMGRYEVTNSQYRRYQAEHHSGNMKAYSLDGEKLVRMARWLRHLLEPILLMKLDCMICLAMSGTWCEDMYGKDAYKNHAKADPVYRLFESGSNYRLIRGGSWLSGPDSV